MGAGASRRAANPGTKSQGGSNTQGQTRKGKRPQVPTDPDIDSLNAQIIKAKAEAKDVFAALLATAKGKSLASITTPSGRTYQSVEIIVATPDGIRIQHLDGTANLPLKEIPSPWKEQFAYDLQRPVEEQAPTRSPTTQQALAQVESAPPTPQPKTTAEIEKAILDQTKASERVANLRMQAERLIEQANQYELEASEHSMKASSARAAGRPSMQDAEATKDRETARQLRLRADNALSEALRIEREIRATR